MTVSADVLYRDTEFVTGGRLQVLECLTRSVAAICRNDRTVRKLYIGKGSGANARQAMQDRYDEYKRRHQINEVIALYESSSERFALETEAYLETYFRERNSTMVARLVNRTGGGGGRPARQPYFYVYLAVRRID